MKFKSIGKCNFCDKVYSGSAMTNHLKSCQKRKNKIEPESNEDKILLIKASCKPFWVYFEVNAANKLKEIDELLRYIWLECCGHLSMFTINNANYSSSPQIEYDDKSMNVVIEKVISPNQDFLHEYDFGTTTSLELKCVSERQGNIKKIEVLAMNDFPEEFKCKCGKKPTDICTQCVWETNDCFFCDDCAKKHENKSKDCEEMMLPVVNSPRMGMCGYTGYD